MSTYEHAMHESRNLCITFIVVLENSAELDN